MYSQHCSLTILTAPFGFAPPSRLKYYSQASTFHDSPRSDYQYQYSYASSPHDLGPIEPLHAPPFLHGVDGQGHSRQLSELSGVTERSELYAPISPADLQAHTMERGSPVSPETQHTPARDAVGQRHEETTEPDAEVRRS